VTYEQSAEAAG